MTTAGAGLRPARGPRVTRARRRPTCREETALGALRSVSPEGSSGGFADADSEAERLLRRPARRRPQVGCAMRVSLNFQRITILPKSSRPPDRCDATSISIIVTNRVKLSGRRDTAADLTMRKKACLLGMPSVLQDASFSAAAAGCVSSGREGRGLSARGGWHTPRQGRCNVARLPH